ncbi:MAG: TonB-dependent receptor [Bacteroidota bacterium]
MGAWLVLLVLAGPVAAQPAQVLTRSDIDAAGAVSFIDLFRLLDAARSSTIDGFDARVAFGSGAAFQTTDWLLTVDGVPMHLDLFGHVNLEALPINLHEVERVTWTPGPAYVRGRPTAGGVLALETTRDTDEPIRLIQGTVMAGNEIGDPGPWRYTDRATANVDKLGPGYEVSTYLQTTTGRLQVSQRALQLHPTDPAARERNLALTRREPGAYPKNWVIAGSLRGQASRLPGAPRLAVLGGVMNDYTFLSSVSREQPVERRYVQAVGHGAWTLDSGFAVRYHLDYAFDDLDRSPLAPDPTDPAAPSLAWQQQRATAWVGLGSPSERWSVGLSGALQRSEAAAFRAWTRIVGLDGHTRLDGAWGQIVASGSANTDGRDLGGGVSLEASPRTGDGSVVAVTLAAHRLLPPDQPTYGFWRSEGYAGVEPAEVAYTPAGPRPRTDLTVRVAAQRPLLPATSAKASVGWRWANDVFVEERAFVLDANGVPTSGQVVAVPDAQGHVLHAGLTLTAQASIVATRAFYDGRYPVGGSAAFEAAWRAVPQHRAGVRATAQVDRSFTAQAALTVESRTRWVAYDGSAATTGGTYDDTLPARWLLDVGVDKTLWRDRVRLHLALRNLLNIEERTHPLGAALDLRLYARATVKLWGG